MARVAPPLAATGKFPRAARVRRRREFTRIQGEGLRVHTDAFTIVVSSAEGGRARLGLTVSKKVGNSVVRNRVRRVLREIFRRRAAELPAIDLVIIAKPSAATLAAQGFGAVADEVLPAIESAVVKHAARARRRERRE
jgi:ribonuclease P protein component